MQVIHVIFATILEVVNLGSEASYKIKILQLRHLLSDGLALLLDLGLSILRLVPEHLEQGTKLLRAPLILLDLALSIGSMPWVDVAHKGHISIVGRLINQVEACDATEPCESSPHNLRSQVLRQIPYVQVIRAKSIPQLVVFLLNLEFRFVDRLHRQLPSITEFYAIEHLSVFRTLGRLKSDLSLLVGEPEANNLVSTDQVLQLLLVVVLWEAGYLQHIVLWLFLFTLSDAVGPEESDWVGQLGSCIESFTASLLGLEPHEAVAAGLATYGVGGNLGGLDLPEPFEHEVQIFTG